MFPIGVHRRLAFFRNPLRNLRNRLAELAAEDLAEERQHLFVQRAVIGQQVLATR